LLLARLHASRLRSLADASPETLREWLREINAGGQLNVLLADGDHVVAYRDADGRGQLHWTRRLPPHATTTLGRPSVEIALDAPEDPSRTVLIFSSLPLGDGPWQALSPGELIVVRRGSVLWTSAPERSVPAAAPVAAGPFLANGPVNDSSWSETSHQAAAAQALMPEPIAPALESGLPPVPVRRKPSAAESATRRMQVFHETVYRYQEPVERSSHRLLLRPVEDRHQTLLEHSLEIQPAVVRPEFEDVFGNAATALEIRDPYQQLSIRSQSTVLLHGLRSLEQRAAHRRHGIPLVWMPWQRQMLSAYLLPPELPETQLQELSEFAMSFVERNDYDLVGTVLDLNERIYRDFEYVSGSTTVATTAFEVYQSRRGVCQDFANLMICLARLLHIPARYRMGYIYTGANYENQIQSDASHAWVELYLPQVGWHGLDPTNGIQVGLDHVRVACGRNYRDATPTSGTIYKGGGMETLEIRVQVQDLDDGDFAGSA
ncbi:MAG TPA: transglutaminase domain-containing protein, partial [Myxococcota bacterium]|nr:transglutaminase domain-containing protein [Myxococcota bacterium]